MADEQTTTKPAAPAPASQPKPRAALFDAGSYTVTDVRDELIWVVDETQLASILAGSKVALADRKVKRAKPGETVTGLPAVSIKGLLADGWIVKVGEPWQIRAKVEGGGA